MNIKVKNQAELDAALKAGHWPICVGSAYFETSGAFRAEARENSQVTARENSQVTAWENSQVTAWGNSQVTAWENSQVTARENSQVTARENSQVTAWGNSQVTARENSQVTAWENSQVTAWENSQVTARENSQVTAWENSQVTAWENSQVTAWGNSQVLAAGAATIHAGPYNAVTKVHPDAKVTGGVLIEPPPITTPELWCGFYGVEVTDGVALLYKGVGADYHSQWNTDYSPGTMPVADDWDGMERECGGGLHFSPSPGHTLGYCSNPKHFMACPVALVDIVVHYPAQFPDKIKARGLYAPCYEVDIYGNRIERIVGTA